jgi:hypothetical protein
MGEVMITDLLPDTLIPVAASSSGGAVEWWGNLLTVEVGQLPSGQTTTITITAKIRDGATPAAVIVNRASLLYTGHVAVQTPNVPLTVGR